MAKHTQGPWRVETGARGTICIVSDDAWIAGEIDNGGLDDGVADANARLIAAAPDMLAEIEKQIAWLKHIRAEVEKEMRGSILLGVDQSIKYIGAAIAKARGEA